MDLLLSLLPGLGGAKGVVFEPLCVMSLKAALDLNAPDEQVRVVYVLY